MSDSEARERRRNKLLGSKEERMSRILGQTSDDSEGKDSSKIESVKQDKPVAPKKEVTESKPKQASPPKAQEKQPVPEKQVKLQAQIPMTKPSRRTHVIVILLGSILFWSAVHFSKLYHCTTHLSSNICSLVHSNTYTMMISLFCILETEEFLFGRLSSASSPLDWTVLLKDFVLFSFVLILLSFINTSLLN